MKFVEKLAQWALSFDAGDLPRDVELQTKLIFLDSLGCAFAALPEEAPRSTLRVVESLGGTPECTVIGTSLRTSVLNALLANGVLIRTLDMNDLYFGPSGIGHPSDNVAVALTVGERQGSPGREVLAAIAVGYEAYCRILDQTDPRGPWDHTTTSGLVAPIIAGRLMRLEAEQLANALALSIAHCNTLSVIRHGELSAAKSTANSIVAQTGVLATLLAAQGVTGPAEAMEAPLGFAQTILGGADLDALIAPIDGRFRLMDVSIKAFPSIGTSQAAVAAALQARSSIADPAEQIEHVEVIMADIPFVRGQVGDELRRRPATRESADHSFYYIVAVALLDGEITPRQFETGRWFEPSVLAMMDRMTIRTDPALNSYIPGGFPCAIRLTTREGRSVLVEVPYAPGHPRNRLSVADVESKFNRSVAGVLDERRRARIVQLVESLQDSPSIRELAGHLGG